MKRSGQARWFLSHYVKVNPRLNTALDGTENLVDALLKSIYRVTGPIHLLIYVFCRLSQFGLTPWPYFRLITEHKAQLMTSLSLSLPLPCPPLPPSPSFRQGLRVRSPLSLLCTTLELRRGEDLKRSVCLCSSLVSSTPRPGPKGHLYAQRPLEWI